MNFVEMMRDLAKTNYYQTLYIQSKDMKMSLFKNDRDFTDLQVSFLNDLNFYSNLYTDLAMGEISEIIFEDQIYEDAYQQYKIYAQKKETENSKSQKNKVGSSNHQVGDKKVTVPIGTSEFVFTRPPKR